MEFCCSLPSNPIVQFCMLKLLLTSGDCHIPWLQPQAFISFCFFLGFPSLIWPALPTCVLLCGDLFHMSLLLISIWPVFLSFPYVNRLLWIPLSYIGPRDRHNFYTKENGYRKIASVLEWASWFHSAHFLWILDPCTNEAWETSVLIQVPLRSIPAPQTSLLISLLSNPNSPLKSDDTECFINTISPKWKHMLLRSLYHQII